MLERLTPDKEKKIKLACVLVILLLVPAFVVYYEYEIAAANNIQQMKEHAIAQYQPVTQGTINKITKNGP